MKNDYDLGEEIRCWGINLPEDLHLSLKKTFDSGWINTGPKEQQFRELLKAQFGGKYATACMSGTAALNLALSAAGVTLGDEVISTPYTWLATNTAILERGAKPVFADIRYDDWNIDPDDVVKKITDKTKAIIGVHYAGNALQLDKLRSIAKDYDIPLIEDCAHAMGSFYDGNPIGHGADYACFSFQCVKIVTCGDGGAVLTNSKNSYERLQRLCWYGIDKSLKRLEFIDPVPHHPEELGYKYNMNDITATMAISAMNVLDGALQKRAQMAQLYNDKLQGSEVITPAVRHPQNTPNYQIYPVHVKDRTKLAKLMLEDNIHLTVNNRRNDLYPVFGGLADLPVAERCDGDTILLPLHLGLSEDHLSRIFDKIDKYTKIA